MAVKIIIDSTADLMPAVKQNLTVVPLTVRFGEEEFVDGVTITHQTFYEKLTTAKVMPTTSQATPAEFEDVFASITAAGDSAVVLTLSQKLSGTYQSACIAADDFDNIFVVDTASVTIGAGILAERALALAEEGLSAQAIAETLEEEKKNIRIVAMLDTLEYLKKGGRISATAAIAGGLLNLKPIILIEDGQIKTIGKARGAKQGNTMLIQQVEKAGVDLTRPYIFGYTGTSEEGLLKFMDDCQEKLGLTTGNDHYSCLGSVIGTHAGPGAFAVAFFQK